MWTTKLLPSGARKPAAHAVCRVHPLTRIAIYTQANVDHKVAASWARKPAAHTMCKVRQLARIAI
eukprot:606911-Pelagomonas_calceolata.AAC.1